MKEMLIHVGHGKTGSSFLQTCFANSVDVMNRNGITYPIRQKDLENARNGLTTEGNFPPISLSKGHSIDALRELIKKYADPIKNNNILISNEGIFQSILLHKFLSQIVKAFPEFRIKILLFIRDPFEHLVSAYQELLKAAIVNDASDLFSKSSVPRNVSQFLDICEMHGAECHTINFSRHRLLIRQKTSTWLGLSEDGLISGPKLSVNRSLDASEILVQKIFNNHFGNFARRIIADPLAEELPDHKPSNPYIPEPVLIDFLNRMKEDSASTNEKIPESERYFVPDFSDIKSTIPSEDEKDLVSLSAEQMDIIVRNIAKHMRRS